VFALACPGEGVQDSLCAARRDLEDCAKAVGAAEIGRSIQVAVAALDQSGIGSLAVTAALGEGMQNGLGPARRDLEDRAVVVGAAGSGGSVEVAIAALDQTRIGIAAAGGEREQHALGAARRDLEDCAASARAATCGGSVDIAIAALNRTGIGDVDEGIKNALRPARRD